MRIIVAALMLLSSLAMADVKISALPLLAGSAVGTSDSFPFVSVSNNETARMLMSDIPNVPSIASVLAPLASPTFTGTVTFPSGSISSAGLSLPGGNENITVGTSGPIIAGSEEQVSNLFTYNTTDTNIFALASRGYANSNLSNSSYISGIRSEAYRQITTSSVTDLGAVIAGGQFRVLVSPASGLTYTNSSGQAAGVEVLASSKNGGAGTLAITNYYGISIDDDSTVTGPYKFGLYVGAMTGFTSTGYGIYQNGSTNQNLFNGVINPVGGILGTTAGGNATAGNVGEYKENVISSTTNVGSSGTYTDLATVTLSAGDWDVTGFAMFYLDAGAAAVITDTELGISTTSGNSGTGLVSGNNLAATTYPLTSADGSSIVVPSYRINVSTSTPIYLKNYMSYSVATPRFRCRLSARRVR